MRSPPLKQPNPIWINGQKATQEELPIARNSQIQLGRMLLKVKSVETVTKNRGVTRSQKSLKALKVKYSCLQNPHCLPSEYQSQNCPYCEHLVLSAALVMLPAKPPQAAIDDQAPSVQPSVPPKDSPNPNSVHPRSGEPLIP